MRNSILYLSLTTVQFVLVRNVFLAKRIALIKVATSNINIDLQAIDSFVEIDCNKEVIHILY